MSFEKVCPAAAMDVGTMAKFSLNGTNIVLYHLEEGFYATQRSCTHTFAPLEKGKIESGKVRCPLHRAEFDIKTGEVVKWANFPPGVQVLNIIRGEKCLQTYPTKIEDGMVYVDIV
ncbi:MAG TPA: hypothetical protein DCZ03_02260 [Gammaproteobacteria bacterium]|nr:hypothetical protein [Gammaproteobacteria bacterium]